MKQDAIRNRCSCWRVGLSERPVDFAAVCRCAESRDAARRRRVFGTVAMLVVFSLVGALIGMIDARRVNTANLATLREVHLQSIFHEGEK